MRDKLPKTATDWGIVSGCALLLFAFVFGELGMNMALGPMEVALIVFWLGAPAGILLLIAHSRRQAYVFALWGLLSWLGLAIGIVHMLSVKRLDQASPAAEDTGPKA